MDIFGYLFLEINDTIEWLESFKMTNYFYDKKCSLPSEASELVGWPKSVSVI